ncbi:MAG TPA: hypothetical protein VE890_15080 [Thermoguttaceae bacterium]|nr:hypothetical protein [Thermoguttaceae bacterium]
MRASTDLGDDAVLAGIDPGIGICEREHCVQSHLSQRTIVIGVEALDDWISEHAPQIVSSLRHGFTPKLTVSVNRRPRNNRIVLRVLPCGNVVNFSIVHRR